MMLDPGTCYSALVTRDARFDGRFFTAVTSTGVFCRPVCPARTPKRENCLFFDTAAAAIEAGFRPCLRCRPERAPEILGAAGSSPLVTRALAIIAEDGLEESSLAGLASGLGVTERHLRRLFVAELGAPPIAVLQTRRVLFAKQLLDETRLPIVQVALAAGFKSLRRFNDVMRRAYRRPPRELRRANGQVSNDAAGAITVRMPYAPPYDWEALLGFLAPRAIPGVELVEHGVYSRTITLGGHHGTVEVRPALGDDALIATINFPDVSALGAIVRRLRGLFDLGANGAEIAAHLRRDARLRPLVERRPGLRLPGAWDRFELGVRAILGQQVSVAAATTMAGRLVSAHGTPLTVPNADPRLRLLFPTPEALVGVDFTRLGLMRSMSRTIGAFAEAAASDPDLLRGTGAADDCASRRLVSIPGIGNWTASYIAMRAQRRPDAFPAADLGLRRAMERLGHDGAPRQLTEAAEAWRPWRAYAAMHLWTSLSDPPIPTPESD